MASELDDFFAEATAECMDVIGKVNVQKGTVTKGAILGPVNRAKGMRDSGQWETAESMAEFIRADFEALGIVHRAEVVITAVGKTGGQRFRCVAIEDDPHDPCVRVGLSLQQA
jgi:hypothetical protein